MKEDFLHYVWQYKLFDLFELKTTQGKRVDIVQTGSHNEDSGPDFFNARLIIDNTTWAGNVEIHWHASEWNRHGHQHDPAYHNVVLHVVYEDDDPVRNYEGAFIPTIELKERIHTGLIRTYQSFLSGKKWIPCASSLHQVPPASIYPFLHRVMIDKLEEKTSIIERDLLRNTVNWEMTFYEFLARSFGFNVNGLPFQLLAQSLPLNIIAKHRSSILQLEALFFGQAGMLDKEFSDEYPKTLQAEYAHLRKKFRLQSMSGSLWKFSRMRPANFPTLRIAQFVQLIHQSHSLFSSLMSVNNIKSAKKILDIRIEGYWKNHYAFEKPSSERVKSIGDSSIDALLINTIIPFMFLYGRYRSDESLQQRALDFLTVIKPEHNRIISQWELHGIKSYHALDTQALLHLKKRYCTVRKCFKCSIGNSILRRNEI